MGGGGVFEHSKINLKNNNAPSHGTGVADVEPETHFQPISHGPEHDVEERPETLPKVPVGQGTGFDIPTRGQ